VLHHVKPFLLGRVAFGWHGWDTANDDSGRFTTGMAIYGSDYQFVRAKQSLGEVKLGEGSVLRHDFGGQV